MENIEEVISKLAQDSVTLNPAPHPFMITLKWTVLAAGYILLSLIISGVRPDIMIKLNEPWFVAEITILTGTFIATALSAALLSFPDIHQMRRLAFFPVIPFALFVLILFLAWHADSQPAP